MRPLALGPSSAQTTPLPVTLPPVAPPWTLVRGGGAGGFCGAARARLAGNSFTTAAMKASKFSWERTGGVGVGTDDDQEEEEGVGLCLADDDCCLEAGSSLPLQVGPAETGVGGVGRAETNYVRKKCLAAWRGGGGGVGTRVRKPSCLSTISTRQPSVERVPMSRHR